MTLTDDHTEISAPTAPQRRTGRWIDDWRPEDPEFWETTGSGIARRNLIWSIFAEHLGFSVWLIWSVSSAFLVSMGFEFTPQQLFFLVAIPNLVGCLLRVPYTLAVGLFGGRNWTMASAALLLIPTLGFAYAVTNPATPYWAFCLIAATAGLGGGNFASSMANINFFYPSSKKGTALGLNAAGGNLGVALIQFPLPAIVGGAAIFGLVKAADGGVHLERAAWVYAGLAIAATIAAYFLMDNLGTAKAAPREQLAVLKHKQTWVMSFLYIGTFGSFIGYSAAMPLLIKLNFWRQPVPSVEGIGINFAFYAFLGALVGSLARPLGGYLADRFGGAKVTLVAFGGMVRRHARRALHAEPAGDAAPSAHSRGSGGDQGGPGLVRVPAGGRGGRQRQRRHLPVLPGHVPAGLRLHRHRQRLDLQDDPRDLRTEADRASAPALPSGRRRLLAATKQASAAIGVIGAVGAIGGFLIPITFSSPWVDDPLAATKAAFMVFTVFYVVCALVTWAVYLRRPARGQAATSSRASGSRRSRNR